MFLHLGADVVVSLKQVVAILDLRTVRDAHSTREFLDAAGSKRKMLTVDAGEPKSLVLTDDAIYLSPISSLTLMKRASFLKHTALAGLGNPTS